MKSRLALTSLEDRTAPAALSPTQFHPNPVATLAKRGSFPQVGTRPVDSTGQTGPVVIKQPITPVGNQPPVQL